jgi:hypothetical protein
MVGFPNDIEDHLKDYTQNWEMYPWFWLCFVHDAHVTF